MPIMATTTITDLPSSRALDYKAMSAIKGAGAAQWVFGAFRPFIAPIAPILPVVNFYQMINEVTYIAENMTLQTENINVQNSAASATINVTTVQNALSINLPTSLP
jgi:hypothetical protein